MLSLFGSIAILFALIFSLLQTLLPMWGYWRKNPFILAFARPAAYGQGLYILIAYTLLTLGFINNDFSIAYIAANSHPDLPFIYRVTALWGSHEGSILLWILILNIWTTIVSFCKCQTSEQQQFRSLTLAILGLISFCFLSFLFFTSNPFLPNIGPQIGRDLNPLLQDPGFIIHPPMLYMGYVGFSAAFAMTQAALLQNNLSAHWANITRKFAIAAWSFLTLGIALGSWWAYRVLGWGGFWFWDPVENASLLPWLAGLALIHVLIVAEKRNMVKNWSVLLATFTFILSILGTFLVRSGVLVSVHTFASDPTRGIFLLILLATLIVIACMIYLKRLALTTQHSAAKKLFFLSREMFLLLNGGLLFAAMFTILLGTLYPLIIDAFHAGAISVGAPYFNLVMLPQVFFVMALMALVPFSRFDLKQKFPWKKISKNILISVFGAMSLIWATNYQFHWQAILVLSLSFCIILNTFPFLRSSTGMTVAHTGFAVFLIGIILSSTLNIEKMVRMEIGQTATIGPYNFHFLSTEGIKGENFRGIRAKFQITKNNRHIIFMQPEKRIYPVRDMVMSKVAIHPSIFRDLYLVLGDPFSETDWSVRLYYKPFIRWIWLGAFIMILGGILSLQNRFLKG